MRASSFQTYLNIPGASSNVLEPPKAIVLWAISNNIDVLKQKILTYLLIFKIEILQAGEMAPLVKFFADPHRKQEMVAPVCNLSTAEGLGTEASEFLELIGQSV